MMVRMEELNELRKHLSLLLHTNQRQAPAEFFGLKVLAHGGRRHQLEFHHVLEPLHPRSKEETWQTDAEECRREAPHPFIF